MLVNHFFGLCHVLKYCFMSNCLFFVLDSTKSTGSKCRFSFFDKLQVKCLKFQFKTDSLPGCLLHVNNTGQLKTLEILLKNGLTENEFFKKLKPKKGTLKDLQKVKIKTTLNHTKKCVSLEAIFTGKGMTRGAQCWNTPHVFVDSRTEFNE